MDLQEICKYVWKEPPGFVYKGVLPDYVLLVGKRDATLGLDLDSALSVCVKDKVDHATYRDVSNEYGLFYEIVQGDIFITEKRKPFGRKLPDMLYDHRNPLSLATCRNVISVSTNFETYNRVLEIINMHFGSDMRFLHMVNVFDPELGGKVLQNYIVARATQKLNPDWERTKTS